MDVAVERLHAEHALEPAVELTQHVGIDVHQPSLDPLGSPGGARGVVHGGTGDAMLGRGGGLAGQQIGEGAEAVHRPDGEAVLDGHGDLGRGLLQLGREALVAQQHLGIAVVDDVGDLGPDQVVVDRGDVQADLGRTQVELQHLQTVGDDAGHGVAHLAAQGPEAVADLVGRGQHLARGVGGSVRRDQGDAVGIGLGHPPEAELGHRLHLFIWPPGCGRAPAGSGPVGWREVERVAVVSKPSPPDRPSPTAAGPGRSVRSTRPSDAGGNHARSRPTQHR